MRVVRLKPAVAGCKTLVKPCANLEMSRFCIAEREHAEQFRERFGGEFIDPKNRPKWPGTMRLRSCSRRLPPSRGKPIEAVLTYDPAPRNELAPG